MRHLYRDHSSTLGFLASNSTVCECISIYLFCLNFHTHFSFTNHDLPLLRKFIKEERSEIEKGSRAENEEIAKMVTAKSQKREREMAEHKHSWVSTEGKGSETNKSIYRAGSTVRPTTAKPWTGGRSTADIQGQEGSTYLRSGHRSNPASLKPGSGRTCKAGD